MPGRREAGLPFRSSMFLKIVSAGSLSRPLMRSRMLFRSSFCRAASIGAGVAAGAVGACVEGPCAGRAAENRTAASNVGNDLLTFTATSSLSRDGRFEPPDHLHRLRVLWRELERFPLGGQSSLPVPQRRAGFADACLQDRLLRRLGGRKTENLESFSQAAVLKEAVADNRDLIDP